MTLTDLYSLTQRDGKDCRAALAVFRAQDWFCSLADFDPRSGEPLPRPMNRVLALISDSKEEKRAFYRDRLWRICKHCGEAMLTLFRALNEEPRRVHELLHVRSVRELDVQSFVKLSMRPGLNIRQKLANDPHLEAVRHVMSVDLPENRLLKACAEVLSERLGEKERSVGLCSEEGDLLEGIRRWLHTEEAESISPWTNLPPNNTLLSHREYRRILDAWRDLDEIDERTDADWKGIEKMQKGIRFWEQLSILRHAGSVKLAEIPLRFDFERLSIVPFGNFPIPVNAGNRLLGYGNVALLAEFSQSIKPRSLRKETSVVNDPVCIDLASGRPIFSSDGKSSRKLTSPLVWQRWTFNSQTADVGCFNAQGIWLKSQAETVVPEDVLFQDRHESAILDEAFRTMIDFLKERCFSNESFVWLVPDFLDDFTLGTARRAINASFSAAEPLPRSIAAIVAEISYDSVKPGDSVLFLDQISGVVFATKLEADYDDDLAKAVPKTCGIRWTRHPSIIIRDKRAERGFSSGFPTVEDTCRWVFNNDSRFEITEQDKSEAEKAFPRCTIRLRVDKIGTPLVCGGWRAAELQRQAGNLAIWRDKLPALSMGGVIVDGMYGDFTLVDASSQSIRPVRGQAVSIPVPQLFYLPKSKAMFPLRQGKGRQSLDYVAEVDFPPQESSTACRLDLRYTYGADEPYSLDFIPVKSGLGLPRLIPAKWRRVNLIRTSAPASFASPSFSAITSRNNLATNRVHSLSRIASMVDRASWALLRSSHTNPIRGIVSSQILTNPHAKRYFFVRTEEGTDVYCPENSVFYENDLNYLSPGDEVFLVVEHYKDKTGEDRFQSAITSLSEVASLLSAKSWRKRAWSIVIGQANVLERTLGKIANPSYKGELLEAIKILGLSAWKQPRKAKVLSKVPESIPESELSHIVNRLRVSLNDSLKYITTELEKIDRSIPNPGEEENSFNERVLAKRFALLEESALNMELLLALLRIRRETRTRIARDIVPGSRTSMGFVDIVDSWTQLLHEKQISLPFRVSVNALNKPSALNNTPDFLYALRCYLTGDDGANTISITSNDEGTDSYETDN